MNLLLWIPSILLKKQQPTIVHYIWLASIFSLQHSIKKSVSDLHNINLSNGKLSKRDLSKVLETATSKSSFIFDYLRYKEVDGVAMGCAYAIKKENGWIIVQSTLNL